MSFAIAALLAAIAGCGPASSAKSDGAQPLTVGFVYIGSRDDYGYNQAHAAGAAAVKKMPGVKVFEEEKVADTLDCRKTMKSMIEIDEAKVIFATSFGYFDPHVLKLAREYPERHVPPLRRALRRQSRIPKNVGTYFGFIDECQYLSGIVAGHMHEDEEARLRGRQADSAGAAQRQRLRPRRPQRRSGDHRAPSSSPATGRCRCKEAEAANSLIDPAST